MSDSGGATCRLSHRLWLESVYHRRKPIPSATFVDTFHHEIRPARIGQAAVDFSRNSFDNCIMTTETIPTDVMNDAQAVADAVAAGKPVDPEVARRILERSRLAQAELLKKFGVREIAVDLIREIREE